MTLKERVQKKLRPKVAQFGFTKKVVRSIAADIAGKLDLDEDASDEETDAAIDKAIEAVAPSFPLIQSQANGLLDEWKRNQANADDEDNGQDLSDDDARNSGKRRSQAEKSDKAEKEQDGEPEWFKKFREEQEARFKLIEGEKIADTRRSRLETILKDTGTFGHRTLKNFSRMKFENDEEFDEFCSDVEADLKALNQERANEGLSAMGNPPGGKGKGREKEQEEVTDAEIQAIVAAL